MSAQVIAALRRRAAALEDEAHQAMMPPPPAGELLLRSRVRSPEHLLVLAAEFTALADLAESGIVGLVHPEGAGDGSDSG